MALGRSVDPKLAQEISADIDELDGKPAPKTTAKQEPTQACDCTGGPGRNNKPGTGLLDDYTLCPDCQGSGRVPVAQG